MITCEFTGDDGDALRARALLAALTKPASAVFAYGDDRYRMTVRVEHGDCREVIKTFADASVDSCVTDPPYSLVSIQKRFGKPGQAPAQHGTDGLYRRASAGFMGQQWDNGETAHDPAFWAEVYRVLKPGAHLVAFGGTRTYHRMVCAIEDAGFEIRDQLGWAYGSGFPKSHNVGKALDRRGGASIAWFGPWLRAERAQRGIAQKELAKHFPSKTGGLTGCVANWELGLNLPTPDQFNTLCEVLSLPFAKIEEAQREVVGRNDRAAGWFAAQDGHDITAHATDAARQWDGWGTALKPAWEPICLARKPLSGTVAETVLEHGTGALNIDGCRVPSDEPNPSITRRQGSVAHLSDRPAAETEARGKMADRRCPESYRRGAGDETLGRWPANLVHDGSDEVLATFPDTGPSKAAEGIRRYGRSGGIMGAVGPMRDGRLEGHDDPGGSAARFFYSAKADADDRADSKHPTVKPVALMRWLVRLITPPSGIVLDPFAGSGTTGVACLREGFDCILIERETQYIADIKHRLNKLHGGDTPLFAGAAS